MYFRLIPGVRGPTIFMPFDSMSAGIKARERHKTRISCAADPILQIVVRRAVRFTDAIRKLRLSDKRRFAKQPFGMPAQGLKNG
jgi:hypothetical protein